MFTRTVVLLIGFYLALANASQHLRKDAEVAQVDAVSMEIPVDQARAKRGIAYLSKVNAKRRDRDAKTNAENFAKVAAKSHSKVHELAKMGKDSLQMHSMAVEGPQSLITRHRPNGDCSGVVSTIHVQDMTHCFPSEGNAPPGWEYYRPVCGAVGGKNGEILTNAIAYFGNPTCEGEPSYIADPDEAFPKCGSDPEADYMGLPETIGKQCVGKPSTAFLHQPGVLSAVFMDDTCTMKPKSFGISRFGGCELIHEWRDENGHDSDEPTMSKYNSFYFMRYDNCGSEPGSLMVSGYSDSSCLRPIFRATVPIEGSQFNTCMSIGYGHYQMNMCNPGPMEGDMYM